MKAIYWNENDHGMSFVYGDIPSDLIEKCEQMREYVVEMCDCDDRTSAESMPTDLAMSEAARGGGARPRCFVTGCELREALDLASSSPYPLASGSGTYPQPAVDG